MMIVIHVYFLSGMGAMVRVRLCNLNTFYFHDAFLCHARYSLLAPFFFDRVVQFLTNSHE